MTPRRLGTRADAISNNRLSSARAGPRHQCPGTGTVPQTSVSNGQATAEAAPRCHRWGARLPFRMGRSDRDTEGAEKDQHLWGDAVYSAVEDADHGDYEATRNIGHGTLPFFGLGTADLEQLPGSGHLRDPRRSSWCAQTLGRRCGDPLSLSLTAPRFKGVFMSGSGRSASGSGSRLSCRPACEWIGA
jgi:hypothetical protein